MLAKVGGGEAADEAVDAEAAYELNSLMSAVAGLMIFPFLLLFSCYVCHDTDLSLKFDSSNLLQAD